MHPSVRRRAGEDRPRVFEKLTHKCRLAREGAVEGLHPSKCLQQFEVPDEGREFVYGVEGFHFWQGLHRAILKERIGYLDAKWNETPIACDLTKDNGFPNRAQLTAAFDHVVNNLQGWAWRGE